MRSIVTMFTPLGVLVERGIELLGPVGEGAIVAMAGSQHAIEVGPGVCLGTLRIEKVGLNGSERRLEHPVVVRPLARKFYLASAEGHHHAQDHHP